MKTENTPSQPLVSIVTATYNCSHLLRFSIQSVVNSTFRDWELLVVGDHCTDDTEEVVNSFGDSRIKYHNLPTNSGQQSAPNNYGVSKATGRYLCFLNQDDMFFPDHLEQMVRTIALNKANIILARYAVVLPFSDNSDPVIVNGGSPLNETRYHPAKWYIASSWFMYRQDALDVGEWKDQNELAIPPSQEWLFRAYRVGKIISCTEEPSLIALYSGARKGSYSNESTFEHAYIYDLMKHDSFRCTLVNSIRKNESDLNKSPRKAIRNLYDRVAETLLAPIGIHPFLPEMLIRYGGRGGFVRKWRSKIKSL
ncbi:glycosyltransferase family 2 protein [Pseudohalioglobus lutimaris]|uniref:glycosyltransferase family 2 protein n=1 Tax=Pseudohalioglobus lutimaris TaxID=1737061 RepID=UPI0013FD1999